MDERVSKRKRNEEGDTLVEVIISLVIVSVVVGAFLAVYSTATSGTAAQRDLVTADAILRDFAEATKNAVETCTVGPTYSVNYSESDTTPDIRWTAPPSSLSPVPGVARNCPPTTAVEQIDLSVDTPNGVPKHLSIAVRTP